VPLTPSEALVGELCRKSFLTIWTEPNPIARPGKELCGLLVVCGPHVVIISVTEVALKRTFHLDNDWTRWHKKAIEESSRQIYGAERWIRSANRVMRADQTPSLLLPDKSRLHIHRVALALGARGAVPYQQGDFGKGFVHILDDTSLRVVLRELDTISDFNDVSRSLRRAKASDVTVDLRVTEMVVFPPVRLAPDRADTQLRYFLDYLKIFVRGDGMNAVRWVRIIHDTVTV